jgi:putative membrane protein
MIEYHATSWLSVLLRVRGSVVPRLAGRVGFVAALGGAAAWLRDAHGFGVPPFAHTLLGVALGLLLVFRTNSSYDRFWEGRRLVGLMVNRARDLVRQASSYLDEPQERREIARQVALLYALIRQFLRRERDLGALGPLIRDDERAQLEPVAVRPCLAFTWISQRLAASADGGRMSEQRLQVMDANLTSFADSWGGAERILKTPIPFAYAHHIKAFVVLFTFTAPFAMVDAMRWYTPVAAAALAFALFGIEEIGIEIEDPFGTDLNDLPLDAIGTRIEEDVAAIAATTLPSAEHERERRARS